MVAIAPEVDESPDEGAPVEPARSRPRLPEAGSVRQAAATASVTVRRAIARLPLTRLGWLIAGGTCTQPREPLTRR